jgi:hypothetical protein
MIDSQSTRRARVGSHILRSNMPVTVDEVRALAATLPRSYEAHVRGYLKFRIGQIVYLSLARTARRWAAGSRRSSARRPSTRTGEVFAAKRVGHEVQLDPRHPCGNRRRGNARPRRGSVVAGGAEVCGRGVRLRARLFLSEARPDPRHRADGCASVHECPPEQLVATAGSDPAA